MQGPKRRKQSAIPITQAEQIAPAEDRDERGADWVSAGSGWTDQGQDFGDNQP